MPAPAARRGSSAPPLSISATVCPAVMALASAAYRTVVRPDDRRPHSSLSAPHGQPPPSRSSRAAMPVAQRGRFSASRLAQIRCAESAGFRFRSARLSSTALIDTDGS